MLEKLRLVEERYMEMEERAAQPDFYACAVEGLASDADIDAVAEQMEHVMTLKVPLLAEAKIGESWYAAK